MAAAEGIEIDDGAVSAIARSATGSFRDALGTLDQLVAYGGDVGQDRRRPRGARRRRGRPDPRPPPTPSPLPTGRRRWRSASASPRSGGDVSQFARDLLAHLRQLLVIRTAGDAGRSVHRHRRRPGAPARARRRAFTDLGLARAIDSIAAALSAIREGDEPRMTVELAILRAARPSLDPSAEALMQRLERHRGRCSEGGIRAALPRVAAPAASAGQSSPEPRRSPNAAAAERRHPDPGRGARRPGPAAVDRSRAGAGPVARRRRPAPRLRPGAPVDAARGGPAGRGRRLEHVRSRWASRRRTRSTSARPRRLTPATVSPRPCCSIVGERLRPVFVLLEGDEAEEAAAAGDARG